MSHYGLFPFCISTIPEGLHCRIGLVARGAEGQSANWRPLAYGMGPNGLDLPWACGDHDAIQAPQAPIDLAPSGGK